MLHRVTINAHVILLVYYLGKESRVLKADISGPDVWGFEISSLKRWADWMSVI